LVCSNSHTLQHNKITKQNVSTQIHHFFALKMSSKKWFKFMKKMGEMGSDSDGQQNSHSTTQQNSQTKRLHTNSQKKEKKREKKRE